MENVPPGLVVSEYKSRIIQLQAPQQSWSQLSRTESHTNAISKPWFLNFKILTNFRKEKQGPARILTTESDSVQWLRIPWILLTHQQPGEWN